MFDEAYFAPRRNRRDDIASPLGHISTTSVPPPFITIPRPNLLHDAQEHVERLRKASSEDPGIEKANPYLFGLHSSKQNIDPREKSELCNCAADGHKITSELITEKGHSTLLVHTPFQLRDGEYGIFEMDPHSTHSNVNGIGMRLTYRLDQVEGHEGFLYGAYHLSVRIAQALPLHKIKDDIVQALCESACPDLVLDEPRRGTLGFN